jgi:NADPH:quinone reductase-like Zn-dependent oxidoreductase
VYLGVSFEEAAPVGISLLTVGQGMYQEMGLPKPDAPLKEKIPILIYGGSSSVGAVAIQFAKLCVPGFPYLPKLSLA